MQHIYRDIARAVTRVGEVMEMMCIGTIRTCIGMPMPMPMPIMSSAPQKSECEGVRKGSSGLGPSSSTPRV